MHGVVSPQVQDPAFALVEPHQVPLCPTFQPVQVTLNSFFKLILPGVTGRGTVIN